MKEEIKGIVSGITEIPQDKIGEIVDKIAAEVGKITVPKDEYNTQSEKLKTLNTQIEGLNNQIKDRDKSIDSLKKESGASDDLKHQIETIQAENKAKAGEFQKQIDDANKALKTERVNNALKLRATKFGEGEEQFSAYNPDDIMAFIKTEEVVTDNDGKILNGDDILKKLQTSRPYLFKSLKEQNEQNNQNNGNQENQQQFQFGASHQNSNPKPGAADTALQAQINAALGLPGAK